MLVWLERHWRQGRLLLGWVVQMMLLELGEDRRVAARLLARRLGKARLRLLRCLLTTVATRLRGEIVLVGDIFVVGAFRRHEAGNTRALGRRLIEREWLE